MNPKSLGTAPESHPQERLSHDRSVFPVGDLTNGPGGARPGDRTVRSVGRTNEAIGQMLQEFADLLAISGGDQFKVRAYEKAARVVAGYHAEVARLDEKGLAGIPSVGSHLANKIIEFRDTGSVEELDELRARVPAGLRTLLSVPGLGPKRARQA